MLNHKAKSKQFLTLSYPAWTWGKRAKPQEHDKRIQRNKGPLVGKN